MAKFFIIAALLVGAFLFYNFKLKDNGPSSFQIEYAVSCSVCDVTYKNEAGETVAVDGVKGSWTNKVTVQRDGFAYVSAITKERGKDATVKIIKNGAEVATESSSVSFTPAKVGISLFN